jgi:hypothetical protein
VPALYPSCLSRSLGGVDFLYLGLEPRRSTMLNILRKNSDWTKKGAMKSESRKINHLLK